MNLLMNKNDPLCIDDRLNLWSFHYFFGDSLKIQFGTLLITWANDQHRFHYKCHCLMINPNKLTI